MLSVKDINLLQAQNEGLKKQNAELQKENAILKEENYDKLIAWEEMQTENDKLKRIIDNVKDYCILTRNEFCESHCLRKTVCEKRDCVPIRDITNIYNLTKSECEEE